MAAQSISPYTDMVTLDECLDLFSETGHGASKSTLRRWIAEYDLATERQGARGKVAVSFTEILQVHRDEIAKRN
ncbi:hypothetical protein ACFRCX_30785 [Streptomyces sp. NPDC056652]|uniref:hypothetical protein n=1 Tax=Streptomyces sp. NPDC056652 TaxID=3345893 RepID=UPI0036B65BD6